LRGIGDFGVRLRIASERHTSSMETPSGQDERGFRLGAGERVPDGVRRIADGQLDMSIERLKGDSDEDLGVGVHETRKRLKRLRATTRLASDELGGEGYRRENVAFRDAGRRLGRARDSQVLLETLDALTDRYPEAGPPERFEHFKKTLVGQHGAAQRRLHEDAAVAEVLGGLRQHAHTFRTWVSSGKASTRWLRPLSGSTGAAAARTATPARSPTPRTCTSCAARKVPVVRGADRPGRRADEDEAHRQAGP
jgi:CHAD domain-containing protein